MGRHSAPINNPHNSISGTLIWKAYTLAASTRIFHSLELFYRFGRQRALPLHRSPCCLIDRWRSLPPGRPHRGPAESAAAGHLHLYQIVVKLYCTCVCMHIAIIITMFRSDDSILPLCWTAPMHPALFTGPAPGVSWLRTFSASVFFCIAFIWNILYGDISWKCMGES